MRVYAIHTGSYSDQSWGPVFSTIEKAEAYKADYDKKSEGCACGIEVHVVDNENDTGPVYPVWWLCFDKDANIVGHGHETAEAFEPNLHKPEILTLKQSPFMLLWYREKYPACVLVVCNVRAPDLDHAVKIAADTRRAFLAMQP